MTMSKVSQIFARANQEKNSETALYCIERLLGWARDLGFIEDDLHSRVPERARRTFYGDVSLDRLEDERHE